jgi:hypothetical protein
MAVDSKLHLREPVGLCVRQYLAVTFVLRHLEWLGFCIYWFVCYSTQLLSISQFCITELGRYFRTFSPGNGNRCSFISTVWRSVWSALSLIGGNGRESGCMDNWEARVIQNVPCVESRILNKSYFIYYVHSCCAYCLCKQSVVFLGVEDFDWTLVARSRYFPRTSLVFRNLWLCVDNTQTGQSMGHSTGQWLSRKEIVRIVCTTSWTSRSVLDTLTVAASVV